MLSTHGRNVDHKIGRQPIVEDFYAKYEEEQKNSQRVERRPSRDRRFLSPSSEHTGHTLVLANLPQKAVAISRKRIAGVNLCQSVIARASVEEREVNSTRLYEVAPILLF